MASVASSALRYLSRSPGDTLALIQNPLKSAFARARLNGATALKQQGSLHAFNEQCPQPHLIRLQTLPPTNLEPPKSGVLVSLLGTLEAMNRNARVPKKANHGKRPCSSVRRRAKRRRKITGGRA